MNTIKNENLTICYQAIAKFGIEAQTRQLMEECGELIIAANHFYRRKGTPQEDKDNFIEEIADVFIMISQFCCYFNWTNDVNEIVENKMLRLSAKLESLNKQAYFQVAPQEGD